MRPLYVEVLVKAPIDRLWELTQDPVQHARWDLRFSRIVPTEDLDGGTLRFRYELALGFRTVTGTGTSAGERHRADGTRSSPRCATAGGTGGTPRWTAAPGS
jgi:hypothetical protein